MCPWRTPICFTVRQDNVATLKPMLEDRLSVYRTAIVVRGYKNAAGRYRAHATATASCARIRSVWAGGIREGALGSEFDLSQDGFKVQLAPGAASGADAVVFRACGAIVNPCWPLPTRSTAT